MTARVTLFLSLLLALAGCGQERPPSAASDPRPAAAKVATPASTTPHLFKRSRPIMSTIYEITVVGERDEVAAPAVTAAFNEIARLETVLSEWQPGTEISRINAAAGESAIAVGPDTMTVIRAGLDVSTWSNGAFDMSWAALRGLYRFQPNERRVPSRDEIRRLLPLVSYRDIVVDEAAQTVMLRRRGMALGTGGIGKGYALDRAGQILERAGIVNYMMFGGGQVQVHGQRGDRPWRVGVQHPRRADQYIGFLEVSSGSIATSGDYEHFFIDDDGRRWHHIIDTRTGYPVDHTAAVTLLAPSGLYADAMTKPAFVLPPEEAIRLISSRPNPPDVLIIDKDLRLHMTPGMRERLTMRVELVDGRLPL